MAPSLAPPPNLGAGVRAQEPAALMPLPPAFDGFVEQTKRVSPTCLISFDRNRYRVPAAFANRPVSLRIYPERLVVVLEARLWRDAAEGKILCEPARVIQRGHHLPSRTICDWRHDLAVIQRKPGALRERRALRRIAKGIQTVAGSDAAQAGWGP